jgi:hypothetical protein
VGERPGSKHTSLDLWERDQDQNTHPWYQHSLRSDGERPGSKHTSLISTQPQIRGRETRIKTHIPDINTASDQTERDQGQNTHPWYQHSLRSEGERPGSKHTSLISTQPQIRRRETRIKTQIPDINTASIGNTFSFWEIW